MAILLSALMMLGLIHGAVLAVSLYRLRHLNPTGLFHLLAVLGAVCLVLLEQLLLSAGVWRNTVWLDGGTAWAPFLIGPGIWLFVRSLGHDRQQPTIWLHYVPAMVAAVAYIAADLADAANHASTTHSHSISLAVSLIAAAKLISLYAYLGHAFWQICSDRDLKRSLLARRLAAAIFVFLIVTALVWAAFVVEHWLPAVNSDAIGALALAGFVYVLSLIVLHEWRKFTVPMVSTLSQESPPRDFLLDPDMTERLYGELEQKVRETRVYKEPAIGVDDLASCAGLPAKYVSHVVNACTGKNVRAWLNTLRIEEVKQLLLDRPDITVLDVGLEAGFNSKAAFYRVFRAETGVSPTVFRESHLRK